MNLATLAAVSAIAGYESHAVSRHFKRWLTPEEKAQKESARKKWKAAKVAKRRNR